MVSQESRPAPGAQGADFLMDSPQLRRVVEDEPDLPRRIDQLHRLHRTLYGAEAEVSVRSPGRAEIVGCHVDYNEGPVLAAAISCSTLVALSPHNDNEIHIHSSGFSHEPVVFYLDDLRAGLKLAERPEDKLLGDTTWGVV